MKESPASAPQPGATRQGLFREASLARLNSPEQLDRRIVVIPAGMRIFTIGLTIVILGGLTWSIFGSVPTRVLGRGVLLADEEGDFAVAANGAGLVTDVLVKSGDNVKVGDLIARIDQKALMAQLSNSRDHVTRLEANLATLKRIDDEQIRRSDDTARHQIAAIDEQLSAGAQRRDRLRDLLAGYEGLRTKGLVSQIEVLDKRNQLDQTMLDIANARAKRIDVEATAQKKRDDLAEIERQKEIEISAKRAEADHLKVQLDVGSSVVSSESGVVREIRIARGDVVQAGAVMATVGQPTQEKIEVFALLRGEMRKRVAPGMTVQVVPDGARKEEYGAMRGTVVSVSESDVSADHVDQVLRNRELTKVLVGSEAPLQARIALVPTQETPSGFAWWNGSGPPHKVTAGTVVTVEIVVERARPIALVIPALRKLLSIAP
ncbi:MAG: NHLP bacteriocin system secretion protein [Proteobacteria bacterium]|nr:NHLP bacteriocin system secretion protein [Pseudomonadota bacterium]